MQVGAGAMGRAWLAAIAENPATVLAGLVDLDPGAATRAAAQAGHRDLPIAASLAELLAAGVGVDAVIDVTVPAAHHAVNTEALASGLPVLCEKPLAGSVAECLSMAAAAELSGRLLMVSQSRRYWRAVTTLRAQLAELGPVHTASCRFARAPRFGGFRDAMEFPLLVDMAIHQFDLARLLLGAEPTAVYCRSYNPPWSWYAGDAAASVVVEFGADATFSFDGSWCAPGQETSWNGDWHLGAAGGAAHWDGDGPPTARTVDGRALPAHLPVGQEEIAGALAEFVRALASGERPDGEVRGNVLSVAMVEAAVRSARTGRRVPLATLIEQAHRDALAAERNPAVAEVLASWPSVLEVVGLPPDAPR